MNKGFKTRAGDGEPGFTLIELLVVVLILGILMAIAIPTFLNLTGGAKTNAAEADLTTAIQDETSYLVVNSDFDGTATPVLANYAADNISAIAVPPGMNSIDPGLTWQTTTIAGTAGKKTILVSMGASQTALILGSAGANGSYYWVYDNLGALSYDINTVATVPATPTAAGGLSGGWGVSWKTATAAL